MKANIFEIKCPIVNPEAKHSQLISLGANFKGTDHQIDTYFNVPNGRLKLRTGNIENTLIRYNRNEIKGIKQSNVIFQPLTASDAKGIKSILIDSNGIWKIVDKQRRIYFIDNVKFHIDEVHQLGTFMEIEAIDENETIHSADLEKQCSKFIELLQLDRSTFMDQSYSDLVTTNS